MRSNEVDLDPQTNISSWQLLNAPLQTRAILGTNDINEANNVLKWATNTKNLPAIALLTLSKQKDARVVVLGVNNDGRFNLNAVLRQYVSRLALDVHQ